MITIKKFLPKHAPAAARLEAECFSAPWNERQLLSSLNVPGAVYIAALDGDELAGYAGMYSDGVCGQINNIAVFEKFRRCGIGDGLVKELARIGVSLGLDSLTLEVRASNAPALSLYEKNGFYRVGERKNYYTAPKESAVLLSKELK